jgi:hypothetical protein
MEKTRDQNKPTKPEAMRTISGRRIVTIRTNPNTGVQRGYDSLGNYVGKYDPRTNTTYDKSDRRVTTVETRTKKPGISAALSAIGLLEMYPEDPALRRRCCRTRGDRQAAFRNDRLHALLRA